MTGKYWYRLFSIRVSGIGKVRARATAMTRCILHFHVAEFAALCVLTAGLGSGEQTEVHPEPTVETSSFGSLKDGSAVEMLTLKNTKGATAKLITYGATLTELWVPDHNGKLGDVVLGFDKLDGYLGDHPWFGATVGRVANRVAKGKFTLDGKEYSLEINNPPNNLHSGSKGLSRTVWKAEPLHEPHAAAVRFTSVSPDGDGGFPGNLSVTLVYRLTDNNELQLEYTARTDKATPVNLTNHSYFNLAGGKEILDEILYLATEHYTPVDATLIPTGEIQPVKGTPLDFTTPAAVGSRIAEMKGNPGGYDHNYVLSREAGKMKLAARVLDPASGRQMEVWSTEPGVQFYSGNLLDGTITGRRKRFTSFRLSSASLLLHLPEAPSDISNERNSYEAIHRSVRTCHPAGREPEFRSKDRYTRH